MTNKAVMNRTVGVIKKGTPITILERYIWTVMGVKDRVRWFDDNGNKYEALITRKNYTLVKDMR